VGWSADSRLAERIRERVAQIVLYELQDPRIAFVTVTRVRLARDQSVCEVFYSVLGSDADRTKTDRALHDARGFIQREVGKILRTRNIPRLSFSYDPAIEGQFRIEGLLREAAAMSPSAPSDEPAAPLAAEPEAELDADEDEDEDADADEEKD